MIILFVLLYPLLASTGLLDSIPSFSEMMSGSFWSQYLNLENSSLSYNHLFEPSLLQTYLQRNVPNENVINEKNVPNLKNNFVTAQPKSKLNEKRRNHENGRKGHRKQSNDSNVINRNKRHRTGTNHRGFQKHNAKGVRGSLNQPRFVMKKKARHHVADKKKKYRDSQVNQKRQDQKSLLRQSQNLRHNQASTNIENKMNRDRQVVRVLRKKKIITSTESITDKIDIAIDSAQIEQNIISIIDAGDNINKSIYFITNNETNLPDVTTDDPVSNVTLSNTSDLDEINSTTSFQIGNNTMVQVENTYEGEVLEEDIQQLQNYVTKYIEHCPESGYVLKKDQQGQEETCYLCFCRQNETALCWPRKNMKCDNDHYQHNVERQIQHRVRRSPFSITNLFFKDATNGMRGMNEEAPQECKPHESSKSEGCPPLDWCVGCNVCDCDGNGRWDCHLLSFCSDDEKKKKRVREMILSTTPRVDKALRKMAREEVSRLSSVLALERHKKKIGKDLRHKYFFKNGTVINQTIFDTRKRIKSLRLDDFNSTQLESLAKYNLKVRNKDPKALRQKFAVVSGKQAKKVGDMNLKIRGIADRNTRETLAKKNEKAMSVLAKRKVHNKRNKQKIFLPAGMHIPDKLKSARFRYLIGELPTEKPKKPISQKVKRYSSKPAASNSVSENAEDARKSNHLSKRRVKKVIKIKKQFQDENNLKVSTSKTGLRIIRKPVTIAKDTDGKFNGPKKNKKYRRRLRITDTTEVNSQTTKSQKNQVLKSNSTKPNLRKITKENHLQNTDLATISPYLKIENWGLRKKHNSKLTIKKPTTKKPTTNKPTTKKPTIKKPTTKKPITKKPTTKKPTKPTTKKPVLLTTTNKAIQKASTKETKATKVDQPKGNNLKHNSKSGKPITKKSVISTKTKNGNQTSTKKDIQKASTKKVKPININQAKVKETLRKLTSQMEKKQSHTNPPNIVKQMNKKQPHTNSPNIVKRSVQYMGTDPISQVTPTLEDVLKKSHPPGENKTKFNISGKHIYTKHNDMKIKRTESELSKKISQLTSVLTGSHKIWLQKHKSNAARFDLHGRVAKVVKLIPNQEKNDTRRLSIPFLRNNRQIPSLNPTEPRHIPVSNLHGYIQSQNRKNSQDQLASLINKRIQNSLDIKNKIDYYKTSLNRYLGNERHRVTTAPVNVLNGNGNKNGNHQQTDTREKYAQANVDIRSLAKRQKREVHQLTHANISKTQQSQKEDVWISKKPVKREFEKIQRIADDRIKKLKLHDRPKRYLKPTTLLMQTNELRVIPTKTVNFTTPIPSEFSYYKYTIEETTNKLPILDISKDYVTETAIEYNKNTESKRSVDRHLPAYDFTFTQKPNESNIKTRSVTDIIETEFISTNNNETFTMIEGIRDFKTYKGKDKNNDVHMTFTIPISSEIKENGGETIQFSHDTTESPDQVKSPSILDEEVIIIQQNHSSQDNITEAFTKSLLIRPMSSASSETNYAGANNVFNWMPSYSKYIDGDKNNTKMKKTEDILLEPQTKQVSQNSVNEEPPINKYSGVTNDLSFKENMIGNTQENKSAINFNSTTVQSNIGKMNMNKNALQNFAIESSFDNIYTTKHIEMKSLSDFSNFPIEQTKVDNFNMYKKDFDNITVESNIPLDKHFATKEIKIVPQIDSYNNSKMSATPPYFEHEDNRNFSEISTIPSYNYVPLGTLFKYKTKTVSTEPKKKSKSKNKQTEKKPKGQVTKSTTNSTSYTSKQNKTEKKDIETGVFTPNATTITNNLDCTTKSYTSPDLVNLNLNKTSEDMYVPTKNIKIYEIKKLSVKNKHQLKKIVPTLYSNKNRDQKIIITDDISKTQKQNKTNNLKKVIKNLLNGINMKNKKKSNAKAKRFKILKYLQKFFKTMFANGGKNIQINGNSTINKQDMIETLCAAFGPCNINVKNKAKLQYQIDHLNIGTYNMLRSIKVIKGLLKLIDFGQNDKKKGKAKRIKSNFKSDVQKLRAILKNTYVHDKSLNKLTKDQKMQLASIKNNTQNFIQSAAKFTMVLNEIINIISTPEHRSNEATQLAKKKNEIDNNGYPIRNTMSLRNDVTVAVPLKKLKDLITKYNFVQNTFMRKIFKILTNIYPRHKDNKSSNKNLYIRKINKTEAIRIYTRNIIQNLRKLKALAQSIDGNVRRKRNIGNDESVEYMLMMMEFLLKQNHQLDSEPVNDGIDLLLEAISSAPDINTVKKKVLQAQLHKEEIRTTKKPKVRNDQKRQNDRKIKYTSTTEGNKVKVIHLRASTPAPKEENISDIDIKDFKDDNFTSKMEDSIINIIDQTDDEDDEEDIYKLYHNNKSNKHSNDEETRQYKYNSDKTIKGEQGVTKHNRVENYVPTNGKFTTEYIRERTTEAFHIYLADDSLRKVASKSKQSGVKDDGYRDSNNDRSKVDTREDETEKLASIDKDEMPLTTPEFNFNIMEVTSELGPQIFEYPPGNIATTVRSEWVDETYEEMKDEVKYSTSSAPTTMIEDLVSDTIVKESSKQNDISGLSKEAIPVEILNFEKQMQEVADKSWQKNIEQEYGREQGTLFGFNSKENESNDKYADESYIIRSP